MTNTYSAPNGAKENQANAVTENRTNPTCVHADECASDLAPDVAMHRGCVECSRYERVAKPSPDPSCRFSPNGEAKGKPAESPAQPAIVAEERMRTPAATIVGPHEDDVKGAIGMEPSKADPSCRFSTFCEMERWECDLCDSHSRLIDDRELSTTAGTPQPIQGRLGQTENGSALLVDGRRAFLEALCIDELRAHAHDLLEQAKAARNEIQGIKERVHEAEEVADVEKARLLTSEAYKASGSNEAIRNGWLALQAREDPTYATAIATVSHLRRQLEAAEAQLRGIEAEISLTSTELRLVAAELQFLGGE